ncbi:MAG: hypothetical protein COA79_09945 [Planctomycetota bacterium]|nr:MAG: hypothetical protein COA79_09945 [Planctomycetota bacterium]
MSNQLKVLAVFLLLFISFFSIQSEEKFIPEFGDSIKFSKDSPQISLNQLKGKAVLLVFFQSWCPSCNKWSGKMFKKIETAHGDNPNVVLFAIKTDGGGTSGAEAYLKERKVNFKKWFIGTDKLGAYSQLFNTKKSLYGGVEVSPDGSYRKISDTSMAGRNFENIYGDQLKRILPEKKYIPELSGVVRNAEMSLFKLSLLECNKLSKNKKIRDEAKALKKDILEAASNKVKGLLIELNDDTQENRFISFMSLRSIAIELKGTASSKEAIKGLKIAKSAPFFKKELKAEKVYLSILSKASRMKRRKREEVLRATFPKFAEKYPDTYYGKLASRK